MTTKQQIIDLWEETVRADRFLHSNGSVRRAPPGARWQLENACRRLAAAQAAARQEFAASRNLEVSTKVGPIDQPEFDHTELYRRPHEKEPRVIVTHSYASKQQLAEYAALRGYRLDILPWSWHWPATAIAAVFIPRDDT